MTEESETEMTSAPATTATVLVVEDEEALLLTMAHHLRREGYEVLTAARGDDGLQMAREHEPDVIVLDLMLPGVDGMGICRALRRDTRVPIIMVTALGGESDRVAGLDTGADDYIHKPFSPRELVARVRAVLRRGPMRDSDPDRRLVREPLVVDPVKHRVTVEGRRLEFTPTEFRLLHFLASHPGRVFTRGQLLDRAIGDRAVVIDRNIDVHVRAVRKKLGSHRDLIETVRGIGYCFRDEEA